MQHECVEEISNEFFAGNYDVAFFDKTIDGCNFEIFTIESLIDSHERGNKNHRSEMVSSFIRENRNDFKILQKYPDPFYYRTDLRLTVDNPEDLVVCREVYTYFKDQAPLFNLREIINYLDTRNDLKKLISPFCEKGYDLMYN